MKIHNRNQFIRIICIAIFFLVFLVIPDFMIKPGEKYKEITYHEFLEKIHDKKIKEIQLSHNDYLKCTDVNSKVYLFPNPNYNNFKKDLLDKYSNIKIETKKTKKIFTIYIH